MVHQVKGITIRNALRLDWNNVLPARNARYPCGSPPFIGRQRRSAEQTDDQRIAMGSSYNGCLDYVTGW